MSGIIDDINISQIKEGHNPRKQVVVVPDVEELAASIQQKGLLQPILVRPIVEEEAEGYFEIIAGNRRFHACKRLGWNKIACHIIELDDKQAFEVSLIENLQRKTLGPLDEASAFKAYVSDFGWGGVSELSSKIGKSISYIIKRIKLLNLPIDIQNSIINHTLDTSTAEELFVIKDKTRLNQFKMALCSSPAKISSIEPCISAPKGSGNFTFICQPTSIVSFNCISVSPTAFQQLLMSNSTSTPTAFQQPLMSNSTSTSPNVMSSSTPSTGTTKPLK